MISGSAERSEFSLFLPLDLFSELHKDALRFDSSDSALIQACWLAARHRINEPGNEPSFTKSQKQRVVFFFGPELLAEAQAAAQSADRSLSWMMLKAWLMSRAELATLDATPESLIAWAQKKRAESPHPR